jgi:hypothetical protein
MAPESRNNPLLDNGLIKHIYNTVKIVAKTRIRDNEQTNFAYKLQKESSVQFRGVQ